MFILAFPIPRQCPFCGGKLHKHGTRKRHVIKGREKIWYDVQRFRCLNDDCRKTFTLLLPNMLPYKHYAAPEIEQVLQKQEDPEAPLHECGAEESTLRRWKHEFPEVLNALAFRLESLAIITISLISKASPLQRVYNALSLVVHPPPNRDRLMKTLSDQHNSLRSLVVCL